MNQFTVGGKLTARGTVWGGLYESTHGGRKPTATDTGGEEYRNKLTVEGRLTATDGWGGSFESIHGEGQIHCYRYGRGGSWESIHEGGQTHCYRYGRRGSWESIHGEGQIQIHCYRYGRGSSSSCRIINLSSSIALCMLELYR